MIKRRFFFFQSFLVAVRWLQVGRRYPAEFCQVLKIDLHGSTNYYEARLANHARRC